MDASASPGNQWLSGARFKDTLLNRVTVLLGAKDEGMEDILAQQRIAELEAQVVALDARIASLGRELDAANGRNAALQGQLEQSKSEATGLQARVAGLEATVRSQAAEIERLRAQLANSAPGRVAKPSMVDLVDKLPKHPTLPPYANRTRPISMIVVHHTDTPKTTTVQTIAQYHVFGERKDAQGNVVKAQWPGVGYHFLIDPQGVIYQGQRESTRSYHVGGDPNDYSVAISLIGRFMRKNYDGTDRPPEDQVPTPQQLQSAGQLAAWLMQEHKIGEDQVKGHRDVWPKSTVCPGEHWKTGLNWYPRLMEQIKSAQAAGGDDPVAAPGALPALLGSRDRVGRRGLAQRARLHRPLPSHDGVQRGRRDAGPPRRHRRRTCGRLRGGRDPAAAGGRRSLPAGRQGRSRHEAHVGRPGAEGHALAGRPGLALRRGAA